MLDIEVFLAYGLKHLKKNGIYRITWIRDESKVQMLKVRLYTAKIDMLIAITVLNLYVYASLSFYGSWTEIRFLGYQYEVLKRSPK